MVKANFALIAVVLVAAVFIISYSGAGAFGGGTVLTLNPVGFTNDPNVPFTKEYQATVVLDGGANYLMGATSAPITAPDTSKPITVNFKLNELSCSYPLSVTKNTLSGLSISNYQPPSANSIYDALSPPWSTGCRQQAIIFTLLSNKIYNTYGIGSDGYGNTIYCNAIPKEATACKGDFNVICNAKPGFRAIPCTLPTSQLSAYAQQVFGLEMNNGVACVKVDDHSTTTADYLVQEATSKSVKLSADVTTTVGGVPEAIHLTEANGMSGNSADVYARSSFTVNSYNPGCDEYSNLVYVQGNGKAGANTKDEYTTLKSAYTTAKAITSTAPDMVALQNGVNDFNTRLAYAFGQLDSDYVYSSGSLKIDRSSNPPQLPVIQLYINADWLGIVNPVAIPQLGSVQPNPIVFTSGNKARATVPVINGALTTGSLQVSLPQCTPSATFTWVNDPNRAYTASESYNAMFEASAAQGDYACEISAKSGGFVASGNYNPTKTQFTMNVAGQCTNDASPPRYRSPTASEPCRVLCPLDPAVAGSDVCANSGLVYNSVSCACDAKPNCALTNSCPSCTACDGGTKVGVCVANEQIRCKLADKLCVLTSDATCPGSGGDNETKCLPFVQKLVPITTGGIFGIGGTTTYTCENDLLGMAIVAVVILGVLSLLTKKRFFK
jgi:hypothetical protein